MAASDIHTDEETPDAVAEARAEVEETRTHLADTIDAIADKLTPAHIIEGAKEAAVAKAHDIVSDTVETVKDKAAGVIDAAKDAFHSASDAVTGAAHTVGDKVSDTAHAVADSVSGAAHSATGAVTDTAGAVTDKVSDTAHSIKSKVSDASHALSDRVSAAVTGHASTSSRSVLLGSGDLQPNIGATLVETIKLNPLPAAIAGFGLGWLALSLQRQRSAIASANADLGDTYNISVPAYPGSSSGNQFATASNGGTVTALRDRASDVAHTVTDKASDLAGAVSDKASGIAGTVSDKASDVASAVSDKASDLKGRATDWAGGVRDNAGVLRDRAGDTLHNLAGQTKTQAGAASDSVDQFIHEQPLAAGAIALLIGAAIGYSLPATKKENEFLGPHRDYLIDQGVSAAQDVANKVQNVSTVALGQARDSLSQTVDQTKQQLQQTVQQTKDTVVHEAQSQGLTPAAS